MNFTLLSGGIILAGLATIALGLFLLQRLRVRYRPVTVETTLFWKEALEEARARVLVKRFRHPWAYLLLLAISSLLWLGLSGPEFGAGRDLRRLVLIDGSQAMATGDRFAAAVAMAEDELRALPSDSRSVVLCADQARSLLLPAENPLLLRARLGGFVPTASVPRFEAVASSFVRAGGAGPVEIILVGDGEFDAGFAASLPKGSILRRLTPPAGARAARLLELGQGFASSGLHDRVDVLVRIALEGGAMPQFSAQIDERPVTASSSRTEQGVLRLEFNDLPARAGIFAITIDRGAPIARLALADHRPIAIMLEADLPEALTQALGADPGAEVATSAADIVVRRAGSDFGGELPAFELGSVEDQAETFFFQHEVGDDSDAVLARLVDELGLARIDGPALAESLQQTVQVAAAPGARRSLRIWSELLLEDRGFISGAEFPVFVGRSLRWLAGRHDAPSRVAVGEAIALGSKPIESPQGMKTVTLGDRYLPLRAGRHVDGDGQVLEASVLAPGLAGGAAVMPTLNEKTGGGFDALELLLLGALALLLVEWFLLKTGRIP